MASDDAARSFYGLHFIVGIVAAMVPVRGAARRWAPAGALAILAAIFVAGLFRNLIAAACRSAIGTSSSRRRCGD